MRGIALGGFMGTGKSTVGRRLAARLGVPFVDSDAVIAARWGPIPRQFAEDGEPTFRARERAVIAEIAGGPPVVLATGGGAWVDPINRDALRDGFDRVVLTAPLEVIRRRLGDGAGRPLADEALAARYEARRPAYADADLVLDTATRDVDATVEAVLAWRSGNG